MPSAVINQQPITCVLDHLVICSQALEAGVDWFEQLSGVRLPQGGHHPLMGTHNHLSALSEKSFLELIATDPDAPSPDHKRWFNLDSETFQASLRRQPQLTTWVVGTDNLPAALEAVRAAGMDAGELVELTRGDLRWDIALRQDGTLACDGAFPILIQWPSDVNPVARMQDQGIRLEKLQVRHPEANLIAEALLAISAGHLTSVEQGDAGLSATLSTGNHSFNL